ncbi:MAG TPA: TonB-dependent receptor, partial [Flavisolibacter sp.]|nr:TonB-dependent receptor [Flavisolibacter sp.]
LLLLLVLFTSAAFAQTGGRITGQVQEAGNKGLNGVSVSLLKAADSSLTKVAVSDKNGHYEFENIKEGQYLLSFTSVGFEKKVSAAFSVSASNTVTAPTVSLQEAAKGLTGVTVQSRRPLVENKIDKMVVNVDASPTNAGSNALEVLEKSPGVSVDRDGNISIKGKQGIIVLIDGKQTYLSGQDLANLLRNMPANQLDQIEIMTQPSAKFDASGNSGILNLRTKKSLTKGFNGTINLSYVQGRYPKSPNSFSFNYRAGKINLFSNLSYSYWSGFNDQHLSRKINNSFFDQQADQKHSGHNYSARVGMDYSIDKKTSIGFLVNGTYNPRRWENNGRANIYNNNVFDSFNLVQTINRDTWQNFGANINFRRVLNAEGKELTADLDRIQYDTRSRQTSDNYTYLPDGQLSNHLGNPFLLRGNLPAKITIYSGKVDYVHPLTKESKFEAGVKSSIVTTDNDAQYTVYSLPESKWMVDNTRSNRFKYEENINAAYVNYSRQIKKWGIQTGLRLENTISKGHQLGNAVQKDSSFKKNYTQLFPTAYLSYAMNDNNQFGLSYGRRIERPNYQDMNPFQYFLDQYTYRQGNPNLTPQFTHNIELSHNYKKALNTTLSYTSTTDILNDILKQNDETKVTFQTKENVAKRQTLGLSVSYNAPVTKWWTTSIFMNVNNSHYEGIVNNAPLDVTLTSFMGNASQQFRFAKTWSAEVNGFYRTSAQETGLFLIKPMGVVSFGFGKQIFQNKGSLKLNIYDPFYIQQARVVIKHENIDAYVVNKWDNRRVGLNFTYRFSKGQNVQPQRRSASSAQEEQNRVGGNGQ